MNKPNTGWHGSANDDLFRSGYIQWLIHQKLQKNTFTDGNKIPKNIIQFWHDFSSLPEDVHKCLDSWSSLIKKGYKIILYDDIKARNFIKNHYAKNNLLAYDKCYHPAMKCDYFRMCYIYKCGGFYVDADEVFTGCDIEYLFSDNKLKVQSLCYDLSENKMIDPVSFLEDVSFPKNRIFYVNNNPIISPPNHKLLECAINRSTNILLTTIKPDIQFATGPGNFSACLVDHAKELRKTKKKFDFTVINNWEDISKCEWFLSYRNDERNWRLVKT